MKTKDKIRINYYNDNYVEEVEMPKPKKRLKKFLGLTLCFILAFVIFVFAISFVMSLFLPQNTNILIMATDLDGTRTDTLMLASFNKNDKDITIVSIPRDTYVTVDDISFSLMKEDYPKPSYKSMKLNAVHHYGGEKHGTSLVVEEVSKLLDLKIDYYVKVDFKAFRYIIDSVGGIDFYVPRSMRYTDPLQDLHINLKKGQQHLNGEKAEQLLRYRSGYADADLGRVSVQQDFMKAFISQVFSKSNLLKHPKAFLDAVFKYDYVETNLTISDIFPYIFPALNINTENTATHTLPGSSTMRGGQSVYLMDATETEKIINELKND